MNLYLILNGRGPVARQRRQKMVERILGLTSSRALLSMTVISSIIMVLDSILVSVYISMPRAPGPLANYYLFWIFVAFFLFSNALFLTRIARVRLRDNRIAKKALSLPEKVIVINQILLSVVLIVIPVQIHLEGGYHLVLSLIVVYLSHITAIGFLTLLIFRFVRWFVSNRNYLIVLYAYALTTIIIYLIASLIFLNTTMSYRNPEVKLKSFRITFSDYSNYGTKLSFFTDFLALLSVISFVSIWVPSVILLRNYSRKLGKLKYWVLACLPLSYFMFPFLSNQLGLFDNLLLEMGMQFNLIYYMIFGAYKQVGALLFGIVFWVIAYKIERDQLKKALEVAGIGMTLLFGSAVLHGLAYIVAPPFGLITISFMGLGSYLLLLGIFSASNVLSRDTEIRREISKIAGEKRGLLGSIGVAELTDVLEERITVILEKTKDSLDKAPEFVPTNEDYKKYLEEVLAELRSNEQE